MLNHLLIEALVKLPQREFVDVIARALEQRTADVARSECEEARLCLAEVHRFHEGSSQPSPWDVLLVARPLDAEQNDSYGSGPLQEGAHCGHTLIGYEKRAICPICWQPAELTRPMNTTLSVNSAIGALQEVAGQYITVEGILCFEFEDTSIDHFPKVERREPGRIGPIRPSSIWLSVGDGALRFNEEQLKRWHGKRVTVSGTLSAPVSGFDGCGHMSTCAAEILARSIERL